MACRLIWSPAARDDLHEIVRFIARDNPQRAESFGYELMRRADILHDHPEAGRIVPEYRNPRIRERLSIHRIVSFIGSILGDNWWRSRACGMQHEALRWFERVLVTVHGSAIMHVPPHSHVSPASQRMALCLPRSLP